MKQLWTLGTVLLAAAVGRIGLDAQRGSRSEYFLEASRPFSAFPRGVLGPEWREEDVPLPSDVLAVAGVSDYLNRRYSLGGRSLTLYVGYLARRAASSLHHPGLCFPNQGLALRGEETLNVALSGGARPAVGPGKEETAAPPDLGAREPADRKLESRERRLRENRTGERWQETEWGDAFGSRIYCLYTFCYDDRFSPVEKELLERDREGDLRYHALITLWGDLGGTRQVERERYLDAMRRLLPEVQKHFPDPASGPHPGEGST